MAAAISDHDGHEDARDAVGEPLHRRLARLGVGDQPRDLGQRGVGADWVAPHDQPPAGVDGRARHRVAGLRPPPARDSPVSSDCRRPSALLDDAVGGDFSPGRTTKRSPDPSSSIGTGARGRRSSSTRDVLGAQLEQRLQRGPGAALGARLEVAAGEDEGGDDGGHLEIDLRPAARPRSGTRSKRHASCRSSPASPKNSATTDHSQAASDAERDQRVHRRRAVLEVQPGGPVERPARPTARPAWPAASASHCQLSNCSGRDHRQQRGWAAREQRDTISRRAATRSASSATAGRRGSASGRAARPRSRRPRPPRPAARRHHGAGSKSTVARLGGVVHRRHRRRRARSGVFSTRLAQDAQVIPVIGELEVLGFSVGLVRYG